MNLYVRYNTERDRKQRVSWIQQTSRRQATEQVPLHPPRGSTPQAGRVRLPPGTSLLDNSAGWATRLPQGTPAGVCELSPVLHVTMHYTRLTNFQRLEHVVDIVRR